MKKKPEFLKLIYRIMNTKMVTKQQHPISILFEYAQMLCHNMYESILQKSYHQTIMHMTKHLIPLYIRRLVTQKQLKSITTHKLPQAHTKSTQHVGLIWVIHGWLARVHQKQKIQGNRTFCHLLVEPPGYIGGLNSPKEEYLYTQNTKHG